MAYDETQIRDALRSAHRRKRVLRVTILLGMGLCGSMLSAVLLSQPRVAAQIETMVSQVGAQFSGTDSAGVDTDGATDPAASDPENRPAVRSMPTSRIPVRRAAGDIKG